MRKGQELDDRIGGRASALPRSGYFLAPPTFWTPGGSRCGGVGFAGVSAVDMFAFTSATAADVSPLSVEPQPIMAMAITEAAKTSVTRDPMDSP
jgi:hypothetical protein